MIELFAGVGGFRVALERSGWQTVWANQWEPGTKTQHAAECYQKRFGAMELVNEDINLVLEEIQSGTRSRIPGHDLMVGGFPCQDYSVAKVLSQSRGIEGKKGVLWWAMHRILLEKRPRLVFLENVDRLLKSPTGQRGRDFAIILACLSDLGYLVEWRMVNAAHYGFPQRRRRAFIVAQLVEGRKPVGFEPLRRMYSDGILARSLPVKVRDRLTRRIDSSQLDLPLEGNPAQLSHEFGRGRTATPFLNAGVMWDRQVWTRDVAPRYRGRKGSLSDILVPIETVPEEYFIPKEQLARWGYLKGAKREQRKAASGHRYFYSEGAIPFPDPLDQPSRTILTGEGGSTPSRFKHVVEAGDGRLRRLTPIELERLNGFKPGWTETGMPDGRRAFMMGNALVVGLVQRVGRVLAREL